MSDSVQPHRRKPTRLPCPGDSPGKNTGVGCRFLLQCMKVKSESEVAQSCLTHSNPMDCSLPGSSIHGIFQARVLVWGAIAFSRKASICVDSIVFTEPLIRQGTGVRLHPCAFVTQSRGWGRPAMVAVCHPDVGDTTGKHATG